MTIKTILIPFSDEESSVRLFQAAACLAAFYHAHMRFVHLLQRPLPAAAYTYPVALNYTHDFYTEMEAMAQKQAKDMEDRFHELCAQSDIQIVTSAQHSDAKGATASWEVFDRAMPYGYTAIARLADLIVLAKPEPAAPAWQQGLVEEMLFQTARPVLMLGETETLAKMPQRVVLAWNGGREAARALSAALPVLKHARHVDVTTIGKINSNAEPPESVVAYLALHGISAQISHLLLKRKDDPEMAFVEHAARQKKADLVVMGAYSHNRWREVVLGGFTRQMIRESSVPVLMAH
ncbi:universal stress protein [Aquisalinus flavus]|uniref:UspA domain-containing protein n=1 Tax=Aquisalinus flavus TaxID=1526572 RepID=A0A8J2V5W5_9PROT|nr:universal stress protein [Aquisalinus flavus]MBD0426035.1 universal stress protein [Aquisalinus flavus]UNE48374.1 universal stress protein [Aquisalinus flavus]GGD11242.1 hypothetical protein GCM10011342_20050 [Aquisalinus flavus]